MSLILSGTDGLSDVDGSAATPAIRGTDANTGIFFGADIIGFAEGGVESARIDSSGNFGLGVTPSAWTLYNSIEAGKIGNGIAGYKTGSSVVVTSNAYYNSGWKYANTAVASLYEQDSAAHKWYYAASGTAGNTISFTQAMTLDANAKLSTNAAQSGDSGASSATRTLLQQQTSGTQATAGVFTVYGIIHPSVYNVTLDSSTGSGAAAPMLFATGNTERARIDSSGNLLVGTTSGSANTFYNGGAEGTRVLNLSGASQGSAYFSVCSGGGESASATAIFVKKNSSTNRSINAGGTVNASGADYAEYMTKSGDFTVAKGDVVGINAQGKLTNVFADAVSFCVKSTDPSYVGGDVWGTPKALGLSKLEDDATDEEKANFNTALEAARQTVDRIAFAGQVPVNVTGAIAGQYIIPINDNGAIKGEAVSNPTFEQYQIAVGKVIAIESDGRAKIIVKVA